jgi:uncharacterized membrane-anchored protein
MLVVMLMHASLSASMLTVPPLVTGVTFLTYNLALAAVPWVVVGAVAFANGWHLTRQQLRRGQDRHQQTRPVPGGPFGR